MSTDRPFEITFGVEVFTSAVEAASASGLSVVKRTGSGRCSSITAAATRASWAAFVDRIVEAAPKVGRPALGDLLDVADTVESYFRIVDVARAEAGR